MKNNNNPFITDLNQELIVDFEAEHKILWCYLNPKSTPTFTLGLLSAIRKLQDTMAQSYFNNPESMPRYIVWDSAFRTMFSLGADLEYLLPLIKRADRELLEQYMDLCLDVLYINYVNLELPIITISHLRDRAYGMGFDALVSNDLIISTAKMRCGYPGLKKGYLDSVPLSFIQRNVFSPKNITQICRGDILQQEDCKHIPNFRLIKTHKDIRCYVHRLAEELNNNPGQALQLSISKHPTVFSRDSLHVIKRQWLQGVLSIPYEKTKQLHRIIKAQKYLYQRCKDLSLITTAMNSTS